MLRSSRSGRVAKSSIPFRITGLVAEKTVSSLSSYSVLAPKPPPVEILQSASESQCGRLERLSSASTQLFLAAINRSRSPRGWLLTSISEGSTIARTCLVRVLLADPCSPVRLSTGYGPFGLKACTRYPQSSA